VKKAVNRFELALVKNYCRIGWDNKCHGIYRWRWHCTLPWHLFSHLGGDTWQVV